MSAADIQRRCEAREPCWHGFWLQTVAYQCPSLHFSCSHHCQAPCWPFQSAATSPATIPVMSHVVSAVNGEVVWECGSPVLQVGTPCPGWSLTDQVHCWPSQPQLLSSGHTIAQFLVAQPEVLLQPLHLSIPVATPMSGIGSLCNPGSSGEWGVVMPGWVVGLAAQGGVGPGIVELMAHPHHTPHPQMWSPLRTCAWSWEQTIICW